MLNVWITYLHIMKVNGDPGLKSHILYFEELDRPSFTFSIWTSGQRASKQWPFYT